VVCHELNAVDKIEIMCAEITYEIEGVPLYNTKRKVEVAVFGRGERLRNQLCLALINDIK